MRALIVTALFFVLAGVGPCDFLAPPESCDLEVTVDDRDFDVECDFDADEGEYECTCSGSRGPVSDEPLSCAEQCAGAQTCAEQCAGSPDKFCLEDCTECEDLCAENDDRDASEGGFSEDFESDNFCTLNDDEQSEAAVAACDLE